MAAQANTVGSREHSAEVRDVYRRMLRDSRVQGRFVTLGTGRRVHVIEAGDGVPVVHLHGNNTSALSHLMLLEHAPAVRSYLVDRPGMGLSDPGDFSRGTFRDFAVRFVDDVLDALELENAVLVGASGGGVYATWWYALEHPRRVARHGDARVDAHAAGRSRPYADPIDGDAGAREPHHRGREARPADGAAHDGVRGRGRHDHATPRPA
jgi:pimeloyl-ACP methyl ester carboxylesterase